MDLVACNNLSCSALAATAAAYDPQKHEAPIVVGHPKTDAPAHGWVSALSFDETSQSLNAEPTQIDPAFAEAVNAGRYKKISASFYLPNSHANPVPGEYYLRHVGFLGAEVPAVKGMRPVQFSEGETEADVLTVEFADEGASPRPWVMGGIASMLRGLRDFLIGEKDLETADRVLPDHSIRNIEDEERRLQAQQNEYLRSRDQQFNDDDDSEELSMSKETEFAEREAELAKREATIKTEQERMAKAASEAAQKEARDFAEGLVAAGRILPRDRDSIAELITVLPADAAVNFAEGDSDTVTKGKAGTYLKQFLSSLPKQVDYSEHSRVSKQKESHLVVTAPHGYTVDTHQQQVHERVLAFSEKHNVTYDAALTSVMNGQTVADSQGAMQ